MSEEQTSNPSPGEAPASSPSTPHPPETAPAQPPPQAEDAAVDFGTDYAYKGWVPGSEPPEKRG